jgi:chemotaxis protein methyltransferase CheR
VPTATTPHWRADLTLTLPSDREFALFQALVHREAGIFLGDAKRQLLAGRLAPRLRELGIRSLGDYYTLVVEDRAGDELVRLIDLVSTNETNFFRENAHFDFLRTQVLPAWAAAADAGLRERRIRAWSTACSTGQEPYSLAMVLRDFFPPERGWALEILATDISTRVLRQAEAAVWPEEKGRDIPPALLKRYMMRGIGPQTGKMRAGPELRSLVKFQRFNLNDEEYPIAGAFDLVFCRNVLIYFTAQGRDAVLDRLITRLQPSGFLFLGHAESVQGRNQRRVRTVFPTVYAPTGAPPVGDGIGAASAGAAAPRRRA